MASNFIIQKGPGIAAKAFNYAKKLITGGDKQKTTGTEVISKLKPNVPVTKVDKVKRDLRLATQKSKASQAKLDNTIFRIEQQKKRLEKRENKMGGGMMGRRFGYSEGKLAVTPREKQLAAQYGDKKRITRGDVITAAKNKSGKRMQARNGTKFGATRPRPSDLLDPNNPINKRKKELTDKQKAKKDMK